MSAKLGIWLAVFGTLAMMSLLIKENSYYRFFEHLFIGMSAGHATVLGINSVKSLAITLGERPDHPDSARAPWVRALCAVLEEDLVG